MRPPSPKFLRGPNLRKEVFERDHGVCAMCGYDTEALEEALRRITCDPFERGALRVQVLRAEGFRARDHTLWHADHIVPVTEGGGAMGLENLRTLCAKCHREVTKELRHRTSKAARTEEKLSAQRRMREALVGKE